MVGFSGRWRDTTTLPLPLVYHTIPYHHPAHSLSVPTSDPAFHPSHNQRITRVLANFTLLSHPSTLYPSYPPVRPPYPYHIPNKQRPLLSSQPPSNRLQRHHPSHSIHPPPIAEKYTRRRGSGGISSRSSRRGEIADRRHLHTCTLTHPTHTHSHYTIDYTPSTMGLYTPLPDCNLPSITQTTSPA